MKAFATAYENDRNIFFIGNGGNASNASHMCEDFGKDILTDFENQKRPKAISLVDNTPYILAWANDTSYDRIFVEQLKNLAKPQDLLIALSGSGNSENVIRAVEWANAHDIRTFGFTGYDGGKLREIAQQSLHVESRNQGAVETIHMAIFHHVLDVLREKYKMNSSNQILQNQDLKHDYLY